MDVGNALREIREARLYRVLYGTFEVYCQERWAMRQQNADRLIRAAAVVEVVNPMGLTNVNERQARELTPLLDQPEKLQRAWEEASDDGAPTSHDGGFGRFTCHTHEPTETSRDS